MVHVHTLTLPMKTLEYGGTWYPTNASHFNVFYLDNLIDFEINYENPLPANARQLIAR